MEEIIRVDSDSMTVSARELHEKLGIQKRFSQWFEVNSAGFTEGEDFTSVPTSTVVNNGAVRELTDYQISVDMGKHICLMSRTETGKKIRQYFIDLEKAWNTPEQVMARALKLADKTIASLQLTIREQKPLVDFANHVGQTADTVDMGQMAKLAKAEGIQIGRNRLINWMKGKNYLMSNGNPYQRYVESGYVKLVDVPKVTPYGTKNFTKTVFTGKGQIWIIEKLRSEYSNPNAKT